VASGVVIAGAGQAGFQAAFSLRTEGYAGPVTLIGDEPSLPYQRPPLSKGCLSGKQDIDDIDLRPEAFYNTHNITLRMGERITAIDRANQCVELASGPIPYDTLLLATGARNRTLNVPGAELSGICYLRTRDDAAALMDRLEMAENVVVIGGGFIGLEVAAAAAAHGKRVVVVEPQSRLMQRAVGPVISEFFREMHQRHGVEFVFGQACAAIIGENGTVTAVQLTNSATLPADLVAVGIGVLPNTELAQAAGLAVANGILVDEHLRTNDPNICAIGDCAAFPSHFARATVRLESVQNAVDQARCFAAAVCGNPQPYNAVPWFWTDQFEAKLQMVGLSTNFDQEVTRGPLESGKFSVCYFRENRLIAIDSVNRPGDHLAGRKLIANATPLTAEQAADPAFDLKSAL
jgi:3-phenylpropionate/trans-cinnamate dioxygenase ferredoxin reductase subunit